MDEKDRIRHHVWETMEEQRVGRFPFPLRYRIPNFKGAERAAERVADLPVYRRARKVKVNPDSPQRPLRSRVLADGKTLLVPTPRLKAGFIQVRPEQVPEGEESKAASLTHIHKYGRELALSEWPEVDLFVAGSVALNHSGCRLGKGEGYADREYAILRELGNAPVPVISTVHSLQVVDQEIPVEPHDLIVDGIATEREWIETKPCKQNPSGMDWDNVTEEERKAMPILDDVRRFVRSRSADA